MNKKAGAKEIVSEVANAMTSGSDLVALKSKIESIAKESYIHQGETIQHLASGFDNAVEVFFDDGVLSEEEEETVDKFMEVFNLDQNDLDKNNSHLKIIQGAVLREIMNGEIPEKFLVDGPLPFNFQKNEKLIWAFSNVQLYEQRTRTHYQGGHSGVSIKIAKGLYYRTGTFRGHPVQTSEMALKAGGIMGITNKHIYFTGDISFRIKYDKIVAFQPFEDGLGLQKDGVTSKLQVFKNLDGWFCYNLVSNLSQL